MKGEQAPKAAAVDKSDGNDRSPRIFRTFCRLCAREQQEAEVEDEDEDEEKVVVGE